VIGGIISMVVFSISSITCRDHQNKVFREISYFGSVVPGGGEEKKMLEKPEEMFCISLSADGRGAGGEKKISSPTRGPYG